MLATLLTYKYLNQHKKSNELFDQLPSNLSREKKSRIKNLFYGVLRNKLRITKAFDPLVQKSPKVLLQSILLSTGYELLESKNLKKEKIIHHAIEASKKLVSANEIKFLNAILRKLPKQLEKQTPLQSLSVFYSHPEWLVKHWIKEHGLSQTESFLLWNQSIPQVFLYNRSLPSSLENKLLALGNHFYSLKTTSLEDPETQSMLKEGSAYIKDPATRHAVDALNPQAGERILDLCSAPGGKTFDLIQRMNEIGIVVAVDLPGKRIDRLEENLKNFKKDTLEIKVLASDVFHLSKEVLQDSALPFLYDGVLLDAPCSNTGVIQRKPDVRWRLKETDIEQCAVLQLKLLKQASRYVRKGGRLVYSTCSIESTENTSVVHQFLESDAGSNFCLEKADIYYPWIHKEDGAGVFLMTRTSQ